jgi:choline kinase
MKKYSIIIPAAGIGSRFKEMTYNKPKCLIKVNGKSIIEWQIYYLIKSKINIIDFHIVVGYQANKIKNLFKKLKLKQKVFFHYNKNYLTTGCIYSFFIPYDKIKNDIIYFNSDLVVSNKDIESLANDKRANTILCRKKKGFSTILQDVEVYKRKVLNMNLKLNYKTNYEAVGPFKISKVVFNKVFDLKKNFLKKKNKMPCYTFFGKLSKKIPIYIRLIRDDNWQEFNSKSDLISGKQKFIFKNINKK